MKVTYFVATAAAAALLAGAASAQSTQTGAVNSSMSGGPPATMTPTPQGPAVAGATGGPNSPERNTGASTSTGMSGGGMGMSSGSSMTFTTMAPIPDTAENRSRYGQPESASGKRTMGEGPVTAARRRR